MNGKTGDLLETVFSFFTIGLVLIAIVTIAIPEVVRNVQDVTREESARSQGTIISDQGLEILNPNGTARLEIIDWGVIREGTNKSHAILVKNVWPYPLLELRVRFDNVTPGVLSEFFVLSPQVQAVDLQRNETIQAVLVLHLNAGIPSDLFSFSFDIHVTGTWDDEHYIGV